MYLENSISGSYSVVNVQVRSGINNFIMACDPINCARGNLLIFKADLVFRGLYGEEKWFRRYDSVLNYDGAFGKGWLHTFESFVFAEETAGRSLRCSRIDHVEYLGGQRLDFTYKDGLVTSVTGHAGRHSSLTIICMDSEDDEDSINRICLSQEKAFRKKYHYAIWTR